MNPIQPIDPLIVRVRGHRVILDADSAKLYGVSTKRFNEAFKRNRERFPADFAFQLTPAEFANLKSQFVISRSQPTDFFDKNVNWSQIATSSGKHRATVYSPWAFTEHGALMAANILRSEQAVQMSVFVIRAFVRMREHVAANTAIIKRLLKSTKRCWSTTRRCVTSTTSCCRCWNRSQRLASGVSASSTLTRNDRAMIALKDYQERVLESLRDFFKQCARDGQPERAYQAVQLRYTTSPVPYLPVNVDEAHNARTDLSFSTLGEVLPSCIIEFTATPAQAGTASNVLHRVSAAELKAAQMVKLPLRVMTRHPSLRETRSPTAIEQIVGRILRLPGAQTKRHPDLNCAYALRTPTGVFRAGGGIQREKQLLER